MDSILASRPVDPGSIVSVPKIFSEHLHVAELIDSRALLRVWAVQKSLIVDQANLELAS